MTFEKRLQKELPVWQEKQLISEQQAEQILALYPQSARTGAGAMLILFSVIGALLVGSGIILIFARNWDELPVAVRTILSFTPLVISQLLAVWVVRKRSRSEAWSEGTALFYAVSVYACVALIEQVYQLPGGFEGYLLKCSLLVLPICYMLTATAPALVYLVGITAWAAGHRVSDALPMLNSTLLPYLGLVALLIPHCVHRLKKDRYGAYSLTLLWSLTLCGFAIACTRLYIEGQATLVISLYLSMIFLISARWFDSDRPTLAQPLRVVGFTGGMVVLTLLSGESSRYLFSAFAFTIDELPQLLVVAAMALFSLYLLATQFDRKNPLASAQTLLPGAVFLVALFMKLTAPQQVSYGYYYSAAKHPLICYLLINLYIVAIGIVQIVSGLREGKFSRACLGTLVISGIIIIRFFDADFDFLVRGIAFVVVGALFFLANILISRAIRAEALGDGKHE